MEKYLVEDIRSHFKGLLKNEMFLDNKDGSKMLEIVGAQFIANEESIFGELNKDYADAEIKWYESESLNVNDIGKYYKIVPKIWKMIADQNGMINSNYGFTCFSEQNGNQHNHVVNHLIKDANTRQAIYVFNRPTIHIDAFTLGKQDMMCFQNVHTFIRNGKLEFVVNTRSTDSRFGYLNDLYFVKYLRDRLMTDLKEAYPDLKTGEILWNAGSLHIYERDFGLVK